MIDTASVYMNSSGTDAQVGPMPVEAAIAKVIAESAKYRATWFAVIFTNCPACSGEGFDEGRRCPTCAEREDEMTFAATATVCE